MPNRPTHKMVNGERIELAPEESQEIEQQWEDNRRQRQQRQTELALERRAEIAKEIADWRQAKRETDDPEVLATIDDKIEELRGQI